jgi:hypothetical protein
MVLKLLCHFYLNVLTNEITIKDRGKGRKRGGEMLRENGEKERRQFPFFKFSSITLVK